MRLRAVLATLMAVLLLSVPCVGSTCQLACSLKVRGTACHEVSAAQAGAAMAGMSDCGVAHAGAGLKAPRCSYASYEEQPAAAAHRPGALTADMHGAAVSAVAGRVNLPRVNRLGLRAAETPSGRTALLSCLQSCIRV